MLWGSERIRDSIGILEQGPAEAGQEAITFSISPLSCLSDIRARLEIVQPGVEYCGPYRRETVWDTVLAEWERFRFFNGKRAKQVQWGEVVSQASRRAGDARSTESGTVEFYVG